MAEFKSPTSRLARLFRKGRDNWKRKALEKQKKLRAIEIKVRDLSNSREYWKKRALEAEHQVSQEKREALKPKKKDDLDSIQPDLATSNETEDLKVKGHCYTADRIQLALQLLIVCGVSFRGIEKVFQFFKNSEKESEPSFTCIRKWLGRIGLYELNRQKEYRSDWIFIVDLTLELGKQKALVVLGISQQHLVSEVLPSARGLSHQDVELLGLEILDSTRGEIIKQKLDEITLRVGKPIQIVADHSSDLACGINLYKQLNQELVYTHDVTHAMALFLKYELNSDERYESFIKKCNMCRQQLQQTEFYFLAPPTQRSQCRYFNVERLTNWGLKILNSSVNTMVELVENTDRSVLEKKLIDKLGWLVDYQSDLIRWHQMTMLTRNLETQLKKLGLNQQSLNYFNQNGLPVDESLQYFQNHLRNYLRTQTSQLQSDKTFLATSDVIESLFGKYKQFSSRCPIKQMGQMILTISLFTMNLTTSLVKKALSTVRFTDVEIWLSQVFGQSMLSKRKILFSTSSD